MKWQFLKHLAHTLWNSSKSGIFSWAESWLMHHFINTQLPGNKNYVWWWKYENIKIGSLISSRGCRWMFRLFTVTLFLNDIINLHILQSGITLCTELNLWWISDSGHHQEYLCKLFFSTLHSNCLQNWQCSKHNTV